MRCLFLSYSKPSLTCLKNDDVDVQRHGPTTKGALCVHTDVLPRLAGPRMPAMPQSSTSKSGSTSVPRSLSSRNLLPSSWSGK